MKAELPELVVFHATEWREWLESNHPTSPGVWLILHKKGGSVTDLTYAAALDEALCVGWIDGQARRRDDESTFQRFTPRGPRSIWSLRNIGYIERLASEGRMTRAGEDAVASAKADGRWERAYAGPATTEVPADLAAAISAEPEAQAMFDVLTSQNRYALIFRLGQLKTDAARERNMAKFVAMLARHETLYPQRKRP
ncbi:YdeI/OmpD-associated family protein [Arthrobacter sp. H20]|uniref:YdeI/OmpD-associated family protein n=1 Tax=Arthrobacter sp. H20 TaxID=1267981 RepID=UPI000479A1DF|nr:YdeI/OmpD-associated family protein [Arthrobacter sp. H20]